MRDEVVGRWGLGQALMNWTVSNMNKAGAIGVFNILVYSRGGKGGIAWADGDQMSWCSVLRVQY